MNVDWSSIKLYGTDGKRICSFPDCGKKHNARGLCCSHDAQVRRGSELKAVRDRHIGCKVEGCEAGNHAGGYCSIHYARLVRTGDPVKVKRETTLGSFWKRVDKSGPVSSFRPDLGPCWIWTGYILWNGYGQIASRKKPTESGTRLAHRVAYELMIGPIEPGLHLDHLCRNPPCVNPSHLEPVTVKENTERGLHGVLRTHCIRGHALEGANLVIRSGDAARDCRTCQRANEKARRAALAKTLGIHPSTLANRMRRGMTYEEAITTPVRKRGTGRKSPGASIRMQWSVAGRGE